MFYSITNVIRVKWLINDDERKISLKNNCQTLPLDGIPLADMEHLKTPPLSDPRMKILESCLEKPRQVTVKENKGKVASSVWKSMDYSRNLMAVYDIWQVI